MTTTTKIVCSFRATSVAEERTEHRRRSSASTGNTIGSAEDGRHRCRHGVDDDDGGGVVEEADERQRCCLAAREILNSRLLDVSISF